MLTVPSILVKIRSIYASKNSSATNAHSAGIPHTGSHRGDILGGLVFRACDVILRDFLRLLHVLLVLLQLGTFGGIALLLLD